MKNKQTVYSWPDGVWYFDHEISDPTSWKSDDYEVLYFPNFVTDDEIDTIVNLKNYQLIIGVLNLIDDAKVFDIVSIVKLNQLINKLHVDKKLFGDLETQIRTIYYFIFPIQYYKR